MRIILRQFKKIYVKSIYVENGKIPQDYLVFPYHMVINYSTLFQPFCSENKGINNVSFLSVLRGDEWIQIDKYI